MGRLSFLKIFYQQKWKHNFLASRAFSAMWNNKKLLNKERLPSGLNNKSFKKGQIKQINLTTIFNTFYTNLESKKKLYITNLLHNKKLYETISFLLATLQTLSQVSFLHRRTIKKLCNLPIVSIKLEGNSILYLKKHFLTNDTKNKKYIFYDW